MAFGTALLDDEEKRTSALGGANEAPQGQIATQGGPPPDYARDSTPRPDYANANKETVPGGGAGNMPQGATGGGEARADDPANRPAGPSSPQPTAAPPSPTAGMTFAQMQSAGYARPAPPPPPAPAGIPAVGGGGNPQIQATLAKLMGQPTAYDNAAMMNEFKTGAQGIEDTYNKNKTATDEEMARRGIFDSTIAGGRLHDLNIGKRSAETQLMQDLATKRAGAYDSGIRSALASAMGYEQQGTQADIARAGLAGEAENRALNREQMMRQFGLNERQAGLAEKLGLGNLAINQGQFGLQKEGQAFSQGIQTRQLTNEERAQAHAMGLSDQQFAFQKDQAARQNEFTNRQLTNQERQQAHDMGLSDQEFKQRQWEFQQNYGLQQNNALMQFLSLLGSQFFPGGDTGTGTGTGTGGAGAPPTSGGGAGAGTGGGWTGSPLPYNEDIYRM